MSTQAGTWQRRWPWPLSWPTRRSSRRPLAGETVDIDLSSISLLTPDSLRHMMGKSAGDEKTMLNHQTTAFALLGQGGAVELQVRDHEGTPRTVTANVNVRQFNFGVNKGAVQGRQVGAGDCGAVARARFQKISWDGGSP